MIALVTKTDLNKYKYVADSVKNSTQWDHFVSEAEQFDVKPWLGDGLLSEIISQASTSPVSFSEANVLLLNGGSYTYQSKTYLFQGLKAAIIYYAFARYTKRSPFNYTAAGIVQKDSELSTPVDAKTVQMLAKEAELNAESLRDEVITFLNRNYADYPLWENRAGTPGRRPTITVLGD